MAKQPIRPTDGGVEVDVLVVPNASRDGIIGLHGDRIRVRVTAPPERGKANAAVERLLAGACGVKRAHVISGGSSRAKTVAVNDIDVGTARSALGVHREDD